MNKESLIYGIIGLLIGVVGGFLFANSINKAAVNTTASGDPSAMMGGQLPEGHPAIPADGSSGQGTQNIQEVQSAIDKARQEPDNFDAQLRAAELFYQIQRYAGAIDFLKQANKLQPDNYEVMVHLGNAHCDQGEYDEAQKWYTDALAKKPDDAAVRTDLGLTYLFRPDPDYDRGIAELEKALETDPSRLQTLQNLTIAYTKKGDAAKASAAYAKLEAGDPTNTSLAKLREDIEKIKN